MSTILSLIVGLNFFQSIQVAITSQNYFKTELNVRIYILVITMIMRNGEGAPLPLYHSWLRIMLIYVKVDYKGTE